MHGVDEAGKPAPVRPVVNASPCLGFPIPGTLMVGPIKSETLAALKQVNYWPPVGRVDNVSGDRDLFSSYVPVADDA